jgi:photosystem II stability/assembly factor-like uncharacterized protein
MTPAELTARTHIHGIAVDRADPARLYIATHHGLFVLGSDGAARQISERADDFKGFTPHPSDAGRLFASGHPAAGGNLGFIASIDGGASWTQLSPGAGGPVDFHQMDVSPVDPDVVYGVYGDLQVSRDGGRSWSVVRSAPDELIDLAASPSAADRLYAATGRGLLVSTDAGNSWGPAHVTTQPATMVQSGADGRLFAFILGQGLLVTEGENLGAWRVLADDFGERVLLHFAADPTDASRLFAVTHQGDLLTSVDAGKTWAPLGEH